MKEMKRPGLSRQEDRKFRKRLEKQNFTSLYIILCEGTRTEPLYFEKFKSVIEASSEQRVLIEVVGVGQSTHKLIEYADRFIEEYSLSHAEIWMVADKDDFVDRQFNEWIRQSEKRNEKRMAGCGWHAAWSNECFELWMLLHFMFYTPAANREEYYRIINEQFIAHGAGSYKKNRDDLFEVLTFQGDPRKAILYARKLYEEKKRLPPAKAVPCTLVFELVSELARYLPEPYRSRYF